MKKRQLLQPRLKTNIIGGTGHVQPRSNYSHKNVADRAGADGITIGDSATLFGYRTTNDIDPFGALTPDRMSDNDQFVYSIYSDTLNDLIVIQFGDAGDEQHLTWNGIDLTILAYGSTVTLFWNATNLRYEATDAALTAWMSTNVGVISGGGLQDASVNVIAVVRPYDFVLPNSIIVDGDAFSVAWGDGNGFISYADGETATSVAAGIIYVASDAATQIRFFSDSYDEIVVDATTLTSFEDICMDITGLTSFAADNTQNVTTVRQAWKNCFRLKEFPLIDTSSVTIFDQGWNGCSGLTSFPLLDTSSGTTFSETWWYCTGLTSFPLINTSSGTSFQNSWNTCTGLTDFPLLDFSNGTVFTGTFRNCENLVSLPAFDTSSGTFFASMFNYCLSLTCLSAINTTLQSATGSMFADTPALTNPNASEQTAILGGSNYINSNACPLTTVTLATAVPLNFVSANQITITGGDFQVDWGDGNFVVYLDGETATSVATGDITIITEDAPTGIRFNSDTYSEIDIVDATSFTSFDSLCFNLSNLVAFNATNTQNVTTFNGAWNGCWRLTTFPFIDTSSATIMATTWSGCTGLTGAFPSIDTSNATILRGAWQNNFGITSFPPIDITSCNNLTSTWDGCRGLSEFPQITNSSNVLLFERTWAGCWGLTAFPPIDTSAGTNFTSTFQDCSALVCLNSVNTLQQTTTNAMFTNTPALVAPDAAEQTAILAGFNYINANACP